MEPVVDARRDGVAVDLGAFAPPRGCFGLETVPSGASELEVEVDDGVPAQLDHDGRIRRARAERRVSGARVACAELGIAANAAQLELIGAGRHIR